MAAGFAAVTGGCMARTGLALSKARFRLIQPTERWPDLEACRDDEGERASECRDPDGTTLRAVWSQCAFLSRLVALAVG